MNLVTNIWLRLRWLLPVWLPVGLWAMLWFSISSGSPAGVLNPGSPLGFAQGLRALFPLAAAAAAFTFGFIVIPRRARAFGLLGPLGLTAAYGVAGLGASLISPDGSVALWWAALYLSVPVVLWGVTRGADPLDQIRRLISATWLVIIIATTALFVVALLYLDLVDKLLNPTQLLQCQPANWYDLTGQKLRGTGVGRYAAIMGLIAISGLWQERWRPVWLAGLLASVTLLVYTAARGSFGGFAAGASLILLSYLVHAGKRALLSALLAVLVLLPLVWTTGVHREFLDNCVLQGSSPSAISSTIGSLSVSLAASESAASDVSIIEKPADPGNPATAAAAQAAAAEVVPANSVADNNPQIAEPFLQFSGRTAVWVEGWRLVKNSPLIGFGFHADRLLLGTHMHNSVLHALLQAGLVGAILFVAAMMLAWILFFRIIIKPALLSGAQRHLVIQCGGILAFLTVRSLPESTGAFFGVDWLILAPILLYLQLVNDGRRPQEVDGDDGKLERA